MGSARCSRRVDMLRRVPNADRPSRFGRILAWTTGGALPEVLPWVGTTAGGAIISAASGQVAQIVLGSLVVAVGVAPAGLRGWVHRRAESKDLAADARDAIAADLLRTVVTNAAEFEGLPRQDRVRRAKRAIQELIRGIVDRMYDSDTSIRAVFYVLDDTVPGLRVNIQFGRREPARDFDATTPRGVLAIKRLSDPEDYLIANDTGALPPEWEADGRSYRSFIALPIRSAAVAYGMLTVDSSEPGVFSARDGESLARLAAALAFYQATQERGRHRTRTIDGEGGGS